MADTDEEKRQKALQRLREMRGTAEARPQQTLASSTPPGQPGGAATAGGQGARLRELLAKRQAGGGAGLGGGGLGGGRMGAGGGAAAGGQGARLRELMAKRAAGGGAALGGGAAAAGTGGGRLRELLANRQGGGGGLAGAAGGGAAGAAAVGGQGNRPLLRQLLAQRGTGGVAAAAAATAGPAATEPDEDTDPEATRARLRDRIAKMQARLEELDRVAASKAAATPTDGIEDATVIAETPGKSTSG